MTTPISVQVDFHSTIQKVFGRKSTGITLSSPLTMRNLLNALCTSREQRERIFEDTGQLRNDLTILRNGRNIVFLAGLDTVLDNRDKIAIFPPVTGG
jgi:molybdopterin synthase sulfur carrier subunit